MNLTERHHHQIICRPRPISEKMDRNVAVTWRPGDKTDSFLGKLLRPLGSAIMIVVWSETRTVTDKTTKRPRTRQVIHLNGFKSSLNPQTGVIEVGGRNNAECAYDFGIKPFQGATGKVLDASRNPSLALLGLEIDVLRCRAVGRNDRLPKSPMLPQYFAGFAADNQPRVEDTPLLREFASETLGADVNDMPADQREIVLADQWQLLVREPGLLGNTTKDHFLYPVQFVPTQARRAARLYEDFTELVGAPVTNPVRSILAPGRLIHNPTTRLLKQLQLPEDSSGWNEEQSLNFIKAFRKTLPLPMDLATSDDDILGALLTPERDFAPSGYVNPGHLMGQHPTELILKAMRSLTTKPMCVTDADLFDALQHPAQALYASGLCTVQVFERPTSMPCSFTPDMLNRPQVQLDFTSRWSHAV